ncbi:hypothetical protein [Isoptericola croceus]|uniref:hypothetical protein n=1 Tax=Isoptericola croceus TaxID=3031406 RepID=UPI0023F99ABE|nr:hypothetical protein [Isoptericola croceus]
MTSPEHPPEKPESTGEERRWERSRRRRRSVALTTATAVVVGLGAAPVLTAPAAQANPYAVMNDWCTEVWDEIDGELKDEDDGAIDEWPDPGSDDAPPETVGEDFTYDEDWALIEDMAEVHDEQFDRIVDEWAESAPGSSQHFQWSYKTYKVLKDLEIEEWDGTGEPPDEPLFWDEWKEVYGSYLQESARNYRFGLSAMQYLPFSEDLSDWMCPDLNQHANDRNPPDARNDKTKQTVRVTTGNRLSAEQAQRLRADGRAGYRPHQVFGSKPTAAARNQVRQAGGTYSVHKARGLPTNPRQHPWSLSPSSQRTVSPLYDYSRNSGVSPQKAREIANAGRLMGQNSPRAYPPMRFHGIDWRSLELRYVSDDPGNDDFAYSFAADELPEDAEPGFGGEAALHLSSDALNTWLALDPGQFWVNLNPDEPETIIDEQFATTDAGRVLLEADLAFKRTIADQMDPDSEVGPEFWESLERTDDGLVCLDPYRFWVDPTPATVREDGDELYILDAPLRAQIESADLDYEFPGGGLCDDAPQDVVDRNNELLADTYAPILEEAVNNDPQYADLRRVYTARVAAEWIKARDAERPGAFHDVIGSGDVSDWPARTQWDPQTVYDEYMERLETPLYRYEWTHGEQEWFLEITGGVIFDEAPRESMSAERFEEEHPRLPDTVDSARFAATTLPAASQDTDEVTTLATDDTPTTWLGGGTFQEVAAPDPDPAVPPSSNPGPAGPPSSSDNDEDGNNDESPGPSGPAPGAVPLGDVPNRTGSGPTYEATTSTLPRTGFESGVLLPLTAVLVLVGTALTWAGVRLRRRH